MRNLVRGLLVLATLAGVVAPAAAQTSGWESKFVVTVDGTIWAIVGGVRHRIQAVQIDADELAQLPEGEPLASVDQLGSAASVPATGPAPAAGVPSAPVSPPETLLGQSPKICTDGVPFSVQAVEADWTKQLGSGAGSSVEGGMWVSVVVSATNYGTRNENLYQATQLRDERGRTWGDIAGKASAVHTDYDDRAGQRGAQLANDGIRPGMPTRVLLVYNVAEDAQRLELISIEAGC